MIRKRKTSQKINEKYHFFFFVIRTYNLIVVFFDWYVPEFRKQRLSNEYRAGSSFLFNLMKIDLMKGQILSGSIMSVQMTLFRLSRLQLVRGGLLFEGWRKVVQAKRKRVFSLALLKKPGLHFSSSKIQNFNQDRIKTITLIELKLVIRSTFSMVQHKSMIIDHLQHFWMTSKW